MSEPIRIAQMMTEMDYGGVEMVVMNYYRHIDRDKVQFDFFALEGSSLPMKKEVEQLGGRVYIVPKYTHLIDYEKTIVRLFKENGYTIVHSHMNALSVFSLFGAWCAGVPVRIAHNHSTAGKGETKKNIVKYMLRPFSKMFPTQLCACTNYAGRWLFGNNADFTVFYNAIDLQKYRYDASIRIRIRKELNIDDKFVIGHIGRFCYQKNHEFLIRVFMEILRVHPDSVLLLIGEGELEKSIKEMAKMHHIENKVLFLGRKQDAYRYYNAMDCFVLPSRYEGLGMVAIEAQANGLNVVCSKEVPDEVKVTDMVSYLGLDESPRKWADQILKGKDMLRKDEDNALRTAGYEIQGAAKRLLKFYVKLYGMANRKK